MKKFLFKIYPIIFITVVWFMFSSPYFIKGLVPLPSKYLVTFFPPWNATYGRPVKNNAMPDVVTQIYPWKKLTIDIWKTGNVPLWNPYSFSGTPHAANYQTAVFSPINLLFFILPFVDAWSVAVLLQPLLAGLFMYIFLRSLHLSREASVLGSLSFMFCGFIVVWMAYATLGFAALFLPLIFCGIFKQFEKNNWWNLVTISVGICISFLSGHFQISLYILLASFIFVIYNAILNKQWINGLNLTIFLILGLLLAAIQILPSIEVFGESVRNSLFQKGEIIPWSYLVTFFIPDFFGNPVTRNDWFGHYAEWAGYIGIVPLLLAFLSLISKKTKNVWFFGFLAFTSLSLTLPTKVTDLLYQLKIPVLATSAASRIIILTSFSLSTLSGFGLDRLSIDWRENKSNKIIFFGLGTIAVVVLMWFWLVFFKPLEADKLSIAKHNSFLTSGLISITVLVFILGKYIKKTRAALIFLLLSFVALDMLRFSSKWMPFDPREFVYPNLPFIRFLQKEIGINRVFGNFGNELATYFSLPSIEGYDAVYKKRYGEFVAAAANGYISPPARSVVLLDKYGIYGEKELQLLGVSYFLDRISDGRNVWEYPYWTYPWYHSIYRNSEYGYEIYKNTRALPRSFLASSYIFATSEQDILLKLFDKNFDMSSSVVLEQKPTIEPAAGEGSAIIKYYSPNNIVIETSSRVPKLLFLSDVYDKGWRATIDNHPIEVYRADYTFRAIAVPAGEHTVRYSFYPKSFYWGGIISFIVMVVLVLGTIKKFYEDRDI